MSREFEGVTSEGGGFHDPTAPESPEKREASEAPESLEARVAWLEALAADPAAAEALPASLHQRLRIAAGRLSRPDPTARRRFARARRRRRHAERRARDEAALEATSQRARKRALAFPVPPADAGLDDDARRLLEAQARPRARAANPRRLESPRDCYVCKRPYVELHPHYDAMCPECAALNQAKREQTADLSGRVALVTGARVKIGYETALKLLRAGARVVATTRFVVDAAERFAREPDFDAWRERLALHALDLRHTPSVEAFCRGIRGRETRLDFLIHNACQTVRRPPAYYAERVAREDPLRLAPAVRALLADEAVDVAATGALPAADVPPDGALGAPGPAGVAARSLVDLLGEADLAPLFPAGIEDGEGQPLDLRETNSWRMELHEVPTVELLEVQLVNAIAPFVMNAALKPLMLAVSTPDKHVVHVSAMEGQFHRTFKTTRHPHTNMAKAALNMLTRTSAADFAKDGIHMNSVDTGWVTDEDPLAKAVEKDRDQGFSPPLDSIDGAARVLDPIFTGFATGHHCWGQFLKDYAPTPW